jgi:hypothetical protein
LPIAILPGHRIGLARKRTSKLDWAQIKSNALDLPHSPGSGPIDFEPKPVKRQISLEKIESIVTKTKGGRTLSEVEIKALDIRVNDALLFFFRSQAADATSMTAKQLTKAHDDFYAAIKALEKFLPGSRSPLFWAISEKGDAFAEKMGPHPGLTPYKAGLSSRDEAGVIAEQWLIFRSEERLDEFCNLVRQISSWMTGRFSPPKRGAGLSSSVWLIGEELPKIFERFFGRKYGRGESGPGPHFVAAVLKAADIQTTARKPYKPGTIKAYRKRAIARHIRVQKANI